MGELKLSENKLPAPHKTEAEESDNSRITPSVCWMGWTEPKTPLYGHGEPSLCHGPLPFTREVTSVPGPRSLWMMEDNPIFRQTAHSYAPGEEFINVGALQLIGNFCPHFSMS